MMWFGLHGKYSVYTEIFKCFEVMTHDFYDVFVCKASVKGYANWPMMFTDPNFQISIVI